MRESSVGLCHVQTDEKSKDLYKYWCRICMNVDFKYSVEKIADQMLVVGSENSGNEV